MSLRRRLEDALGSSLSERWAATKGDLLVRRRAPPPAIPPLPAAIRSAEDARAHVGRLPAREDALVTLVVPAYGKPEYTAACLRALAELPDETPFATVLVDDASPDGSGAFFRGLQGLTLVESPTNLGFIGASNLGARAAMTKYVLFLNNDTQVLPGWLDALVDTFRLHPTAGLVGSKLVYADGRLQEAGGIVFRDASGENYGRLRSPQDPETNHLRDVDYCSGASIILPRDLLESLRGFDTHYRPAYYEDTDLAFRVRAAGRRVLYQPRSVVVHHEGVSHGRDPKVGLKRYQTENQAKFRERWATTLATEHHPPGTSSWVARDHGRRPRLLLVDATVPMVREDSGSVRMERACLAAVRAGFRVTFHAYAPPQPRHHELARTLEQAGVEVLRPPLSASPARHLRAHGASYDVVVLSRPLTAKRFARLVRRHAPRALLVFDTVDLHFVREARAKQLGQPTDASIDWRALETWATRSADVTLTVSEHERRTLLAEEPSADVRVLSNIHEALPEGPPFEARRGVLFVGGFRHAPNADAVRHFVEDVWPRCKDRLPGAAFYIVGSAMPEAVARLRGDGVEPVGFVEDLADVLGRVRVSVAPLRFGAGVKGKINSAMAHGVPVVASELAVEGMDLVRDEEVLVADDPAAFADLVVRAHEDRETWERLARAGRRSIERSFSPAHAERLFVELRELAARR